MKRILWASIAAFALWAGLAGNLCAQSAPERTAAEKRAAIHNPIVEAAALASPSVVNISTEKIITMSNPSDLHKRLYDDESLDKFFDRYAKQSVKARSLGSGVLFDRRGYIVTNEHVVRRASKITVTLNDKTSYVGRLISADPAHDLAVVKITREIPFPTANMTRREPLMIGETVIAVGNPFGFEHTVTVGVISAVNRNVSVEGQVVMQNLVQTDASINPGNSGGALVDVNGDLIGINTAIRQDAEGIGFAIPVQEVAKSLVDLLDFRRLSRLWLGIGLQGLISIDTNDPVGMRVTQLQSGSPGDKAGLRSGDIITKLNGRPCVDLLAFEIDILEHRPGDQLVFEGLRGNEMFKTTVVLEPLPVFDPNAVIAKRLGMTVTKVGADDAARLGVDAGGGVLVTDVTRGGPAATGGITKDDIVALFANFRVSEPEELASGVERIKGGDQAVLVIIRKGYKYYTWVHVN